MEASRKPQGFEVGKMRMRGVFSCFYDCGETFDNKELATNHPNCKGRSKNSCEIKELYELAGQKVPDEYLEGTIKHCWESPAMILSLEDKKRLQREIQDYVDPDSTKTTLKEFIATDTPKTETEKKWFLQTWVCKLKENTRNDTGECKKGNSFGDGNSSSSTDSGIGSSVLS